jgi:N-acetylmuramoyl-L-alanine amidase
VSAHALPVRSRCASRHVALLAALSVTAVALAPARAEPPWPPRPTLAGPPPELGTHSDELAGVHGDDGGVSADVLRRVSDAHRGRRAGRPMAQQLPGAGALSGRLIAVSPGHGIHWTSNGWQFQREVTNGVREDIHTAQLAIDALIEMLERAGADVLHVRERAYGEWSVVIDNDVDLVLDPEVGPEPGGAPAYTETGAWATGGSEGFGGTYRYAAVEELGGAEARWSFEVAESGEYPVYVYFLASHNRTDAARYLIGHAFGESERWLRQSETLIESGATSSYPNTPPRSDAATAPADLWHYLGTFPFRAGERYAVRLLNDGTESGRFVIADAVRVGAGVGEIVGGNGSTSGRARWQEAADTFLAWVDVAAWMQANDVVIRPLYAAYRGADAYVAVHTNAVGGSATGTSTWTWYPEMWVPESSWPAGFAENELPPGTFELASAVHDAIVARIRANWDGRWRDAGHWGADFGELRPLRYGWRNDLDSGVSPPLTIPAVLVEIAYHSEPYDARLLAETRFRHDVARGYLAGLIAHYAGADAVLPPLAPMAVRARATAEGLDVRWEDAQDPVAPTAVAERWRVYSSADGVLFDPVPLEVTERRALLPMAGCEPLYVRVSAVNLSGESLDSTVVGAQRPRAGGARVLVVDGVDREVKTAADPNNLRSYARIYGPAAAAVLPGAGFDMSVDEAAGDALASSSYDLVIWATGETSVRDRSLTPAEQAVIEDLLAGGTPLLLSGAELVWHLATRGEPREAAWVEEVLEARYVADDAETIVVDASALLGPGAEIVFGDCSADAACVEWPDVLAPAGAGEVVLGYLGGGGAGSGEAAGAAVVSGDGRVIVVGFPLESVADPAERLELIAGLAGELIDHRLASGGACPEAPGPADGGSDAGDVGTDAASDTGGEVEGDDAGDGGAEGSEAAEEAVAETGEGDDADGRGGRVGSDTAGCGCGSAGGAGPVPGPVLALVVALGMARLRRCRCRDVGC